MAKEIQVTATLPALPDGYGPDVHWGPQEDRPHVFFDVGCKKWLPSEIGWHDDLFHAYKREPVKRVVWLNVDADGTAEVWNTRHGADRLAHDDRIARIRVEIEEGRFDE